MTAITNASVQVVGPGTTDRAKVFDRRRAWASLWTNPDYVEDWRANGGLVLQEPPPFPLRRQSEADLGAARWNLLAWEAPWLERHGAPFWADVAMFEGRAVDVEAETEKTLRRVVVRSGARFFGIRLRDGGLIVRVERDGQVAQIRLMDGKAFDPWRSGLELSAGGDAIPSTAWTRLERLDGTVFARRGRGRKREASVPERRRRRRAQT